MTIGSVTKLRRVAIGKESPSGNPVDATVRLLGPGTLRDMAAQEQPEADYGVLDVNLEAPTEVEQGSELDFGPTELSYEQIIPFLLAGVKGGVGGNEQNAGENDYLYTFTPPASSDPAPNTYTIEGTHSDGASDVQAIEAYYCFVTEIGISASRGREHAQLSGKWVGRKAIATSPTSGLGIPARTLVPANLWGVKFATSMGALSGVGLISGGALSFDWKLITGLGPKFRLAQSLEFIGHQFGLGRLVTLTLTIDLSALLETERLSFFRSQTARAIRLEVNGPQIGAGDNHNITLDGLFHLIDPPDAPSDDEGQETVTLNYVGRYEAGTSKAFEILVTNSQSAPP